MATKKMDDTTLEKLMKNEVNLEINGDDTEIYEEVQAVTETVEEKVSEELPTVDKGVYNNIVFPARGLKSLEQAIDFMETPYFKGLQKCEQDEYRNWLMKK